MVLHRTSDGWKLRVTVYGEASAWSCSYHDQHSRFTNADNAGLNTKQYFICLSVTLVAYNAEKAVPFKTYYVSNVI